MKRASYKPSHVQEMHEAILRSSSDVVLIISSLLKILWVNDAAIQIFDRSLDDLIGADYAVVTQTIPHLSVIGPALADVFRTGSHMTKTVSDAKGFQLAIRIVPLLGQNGNIRAASVSIRPTPFHAQTISLEEPYFDWHTILDAVGYGTIILDANQRITYANRAVLHTLGDPPEEEIIGRHCYEIFHSTTAPPLGCPFLALQSSSFQTPIQTSHMDMLGRDVMVSVAPIDDTVDGLLRVVHVTVDITDRLLAEEAARLYLDILAHDIANYLQSIVLGVSILTKEKDQETAQLVFESIDNIDRLIMKARAIEGLETTPLVSIVIQDLLEPLLSRIKNQFTGVTIESDIPVSPCITYANKYLAVVFENILDNAVRYNSSEHKTVWVNIHQANNGWLVKVADNGPGLTDYHKKSLLNWSRRFGGMGIHQSSIIVRWFGGTLSIRDRVHGHPEEGAEFVIWLPQKP